MLGEKIQAEGVRVYFFTFSRNYDSVGLSQLSEMFELDGKKLYSIIAKMIINGEIRASMDQNSECIVFHGQEDRSEITRLEYLAKVYAEKVGSFVETNEKVLETRGFVNDTNYTNSKFSRKR
jgi:translation initiation factor 3 subunit C